MTHVVIVESPAKVKALNKYLGSHYRVFASYGHVRDLPSKQGSVDPNNEFKMTWESNIRGKKQLKVIEEALAKRDGGHLILATDPDREGEAIAWHVLEAMLKKKALKLQSTEIERVTFNAITQHAVQEAMKNPRTLDKDLVNAYLARRALDYLVGFTLSPVLWRKLPGARSAGRVQSVSLRLVCDREDEIDTFIPQEFWQVSALFKGEPLKGNKGFETNLYAIDGARCEKFTLTTQDAAYNIVERAKASTFSVKNKINKQVLRHPTAPFSTSTLQQDASRAFGFSPQKTMRLAQTLYEGFDVDGQTVGLITYMRTDAVQMAPEALTQSRKLIQDLWGSRYLSPQVRKYQTKAKNAQEAHEAIRPTFFTYTPEAIASALPKDEARLYGLIWRRAVSSQMASAEYDRTTLDLENKTQDLIFRTTQSSLTFDGFLKLYKESTESTQDGASSEAHAISLAPLKIGDQTPLEKAEASQHFTEPPPRFSEASLIKRMEELGIGRPSTYASTLAVLKDRDYVVLDSRRLIPTSRGRVVVAFLKDFFEAYVAYDFTADLEERLDKISAGHLQWRNVLKEFWKDFELSAQKTSSIPTSEVLDKMTQSLSALLFSRLDNGELDDTCPLCKKGKLSLKTGRFGAFVGCTNYPDCRYTRPLTTQLAEEEAPKAPEEVILGEDPHTHQKVFQKTGRFGPYIELEDAPQAQQESKETIETTPKKTSAKKTDKKAEEAGKTTTSKAKEKTKAKTKPKPKRASIPRVWQDQNPLPLDKALQLLSLPRRIGVDPENKNNIDAGIGRFGPYVSCNGVFASLKSIDDVFSVTLPKALTLLQEKREKSKNAPPRKTSQTKPLRAKKKDSSS